METAENNEKKTMIVGVDDSETTSYALNWTLEHFFTPFTSNAPFKLVLVHAKHCAATPVVGAVEGFTHIDSDLNSIAVRVVDKAKEICASKSVNHVVVEVYEGDARNVLCDAVDKHSAYLLVVGSHGYGAIKRAVLGSVSDHCAHHAHCPVLIVKKPKVNN